MKELDFDELDRAVNSLMSDVPQSATDQDSGSPVVDQAQAPAIQSNSFPTVVSPAVPEEGETTPAPSNDTTSLATRRSGRFMDVVHPSSDMKTATMTMPSRQGITIPTPASSLLDSSSQPLVDTEAAPTTEWPDPIEATADSSETPTTIDDDPVLDTSDSLGSPFLPDAKVEKRPLGGPTLDSAIAAELAKSSPDKEPISGGIPEPTSPAEVISVDEKPQTVDLTSQLAPSAEDIKAPLPAELDSTLVAIESGESASAESPSTVVEATPPTPDDQQPVVTATQSNQIQTPSNPTNGSIPLQYAEQPNSGDESHTPIYDTEEAHQPLSHPAKKKSGWLWVLWILFMLIAGAGIAAAVYFFHLV